MKPFSASGLSQAAWCRKQDLPARQLSYWLRKLSTSTARNNRWVSVPITTAKKPGVSLRIGNIALEIEPGFDTIVLSDVVRSVMALC
ncbi:MAG: IS66 family insertion sequence element accessory protein TnpB [Firmicutes bacterium]|nr:IS66 family insertion sequence element accessory protein TnpB [Bacillota bacterium]